MSVESAVGMITSGDLATYDVRTVGKRKIADNQAYVSSKTGGKTYREPGNEDASWEISLYAPTNTTEVPAALRAGKVISVQLENDSQTYTMIVDESALDVDIESGALVGISLTCSADASTSYPP